MFAHTCFIDLEIVERCLIVRGGGEGTAGEVDMVGGAKDKHTLTVKNIIKFYKIIITSLLSVNIYNIYTCGNGSN